MGRQEIHCTVDSCYYYGTGDKCHAERIMVRNNPGAGNANAGFEFGRLGTENQPRVSAQTMCETFVPEQQGPKGDIRRIDV